MNSCFLSLTLYESLCLFAILTEGNPSFFTGANGSKVTISFLMILFALALSLAFFSKSSTFPFSSGQVSKNDLELFPRIRWKSWSPSFIISNRYSLCFLYQALWAWITVCLCFVRAMFSWIVAFSLEYLKVHLLLLHNLL